MAAKTSCRVSCTPVVKRSPATAATVPARRFAPSVFGSCWLYRATASRYTAHSCRGVVRAFTIRREDATKLRRKSCELNTSQTRARTLEELRLMSWLADLYLSSSIRAPTQHHRRDMLSIISSGLSYNVGAAPSGVTASPRTASRSRRPPCGRAQGRRTGSPYACATCSEPYSAESSACAFPMRVMGPPAGPNSALLGRLSPAQ